MQIQNNKDEAPFRHYCQKFRALDPEEAAARCGVQFENGTFFLTFLGEEYIICWPEFSISAAQEDAFALSNATCRTLLLRFLTEGRKAVPSDAFLTFRELPWGETYVAPYTGRCLKRAAFTFGSKPAQFAAACEKMGAKKIPHGDAGYEFELFDGYQMQIMVYEGDEEFPPSSQILYSDNFADGFTAEDRVVIADLLISAIRKKL